LNRERGLGRGVEKVRGEGKRKEEKRKREGRGETGLK